MPAEDRFKQSVVAVLAKRAAYVCSNPDCCAITSGPTSSPEDFVNVGEAAHIYGANPGSARFDPKMSPLERSAISNAIWLCGNCHKLVDDDPVKYPAGLLFEWQREHERRIMDKVGKASADARKRYEDRHLQEFGNLSYLAQRIIIEKNDYWEYSLTVEVMRVELSPVLRRWNYLKNGYYSNSVIRVRDEDFFHWMSEKMDEISSIVGAFGGIINNEFSRSWGAPGVAGDDVEIVSTCRLFVEACRRALDWEESVRFVSANAIFDKCLSLLSGVAGGVFEQAERIPAFLAEIISDCPQSGRFELSMTISLPDGWVENLTEAMRRASLDLRSSLSE